VRVTSELWTFVKSGLSSIVALGAEVALISVLAAQRVTPAISYALVQLVGTTITFVLNKFWAFDAGGSGRTRSELAKSAIVFGGSLTLNTAVPSFFTYVLGVAPVTSFLISQLIVYAGWNYPAKRWWVFDRSVVLQAR
jgi:putative flippase GtrA